MLGEREVGRRLEQLITGFPRFLAAGQFPPGSHVETIRLLRSGGNLLAVEDERFVRSLHTTLREWKIGVRGSHLVPVDDLRRILMEASPQLQNLSEVSIDDPAWDVKELSQSLYQLFWQVSPIVTSGAKWVAVTKCLHHVLPNLIVPVDGTYTAGFFGVADLPGMTESNIELYFSRFRQIAVRAQAREFVRDGTWDSCVSRVIDNGIIGYWRLLLRPLDVPRIQRALRQFAAEGECNPFHSPKKLSMALAGEAGELIELFQWLTEKQSRTLPDHQLELVAQEVANIQIYLLCLADVLGVSLIDAVERKLRLNKERYPVDTARGDATQYSRRD